jgi:hypothetical protein
MTGPSANSSAVINCLQDGVCEEVHPGIAHFIWVTSKAIEDKKAAEQAAIGGIPHQQSLLSGVPDQYSEFIPDVDDTKSLTNYQTDVNSACASITFEEIFRALQAQGKIWKTERDISQWRGDSNKFMCPDPSHDNPGDSSFSAWGTKEKGLWTCSKGCGVGDGGGDKYTLASYLFDEWNFHTLAETMASTFRGVHKPDPVADMAPPIEEKKPEPVPTEIVEEDAHLKFDTSKDGSVKITVIGDDIEGWTDDDKPESIPDFNWRETLAISPAHGTFLEIFCRETERDTTPSQFNLFNGLLAVGLIAGNGITSPDFKPLSANFGVVFVAPSGGGKTRSNEHLVRVLEKAEPETSGGLGVKILGSVFSGQFLVESFVNEEKDPVTKAVYRYPVKALVQYDEFSELATGNSSLNSILKEKIHSVIDHSSSLSYSSKASGRVIAERPFGSVVTYTQNARLKDLFGRSDATSGFMNRFLFVMGTPKPQLSRGTVPLNFDTSIKALQDIRAYCLKGKSLEWTDDANEYFDHLFHTRLNPLKMADKRDILTRIDLNVKRLVLAFAVNEKASKIEQHHVRMAESMLPYLVKCYGGVISQVGISESNEIADWCHRRVCALEKRKYQKKLEEFQTANPGVEPTQITDYGVLISDLKREYRKKNWKDLDVEKALASLVHASILLRTKAQSEKRRGLQANYYYAIEQYEEN